MGDTIDETPVAFVNYYGPSLPSDPNVRRLIRRQAMKEVAVARKQSGSYGRYNLGQYPLPLKGGYLPKAGSLPPEGTVPSGNPLHRLRRDSPSLGDESAAKLKRQDLNSTTSCQYMSICRIPYSGLVISESEFLLLQLVPLTGLRLGITTSSLLKSRPSNIRNHFSIPQLGTRKLLSFIPSRYHEVPTLRHATNCVNAKLRQMLRGLDSRPADGDAVVLLHYTRAVRALRAALEDETERLTPETLCATELLSAFEVR